MYSGEWLNNKYHGQGKLTFANGIEYFEGQFFEDAKMKGYGLLVDSFGCKYEGDWLNNQRNGKGKLILVDGTLLYEGEWKNDTPNG